MGLARGLAVFWNENLTLNIMRSSKDYFDMVCRDLMEDRTMRITCLHAPSNYQSRQLLWDKLREISISNTLPWLCAGDFNEIIYPWEKVGKRPTDSYRLFSFRAVINDCSLMELESKGCAFTWMNNREGDELVKERLDRIMCSMDWRLIYPAAEVLALSALGFDHCPLFMNTTVEFSKTKKDFHL